ncbi:MAG: CHAP domain-containing protein [Thermoleophilia bacterium]|nr:CHAP domain-containing protein [Thermoleophilia bacterium]
MSYEAALQRVGELRQLVDPNTGSTTTGASAATPGVFDAQLANAQLTQQQAALALSTPASMSGSTDETMTSGLAASSLAAAGGTASAASSSLGRYGLPVLTVADQYRLLGLPAPIAGSAPGLPGVASTVGTGTTGARMVALAQQELGVTEDGSSNDSTRVHEYRAATAGAENTPGPWCAYFVSWVAQQSGAPVGGGGNGTGYVPTLEAWGKQENRWYDRGAQAPQPGDIVVFDWAGDGVGDHTGIVERVDPDGTVHTIEGNSSNAVKRRDYSGTSSDIKGFVRPG